MKAKKRNIIILLAVFLILIVGAIIYFFSLSTSNEIEYNSSTNSNLIDDNVLENKSINHKTVNDIKISVDPIIIPITHMTTPKIVKAIYLSSWVAGSEKIRDPLIELINKTELNAIVIDIKDSTGRVSFDIPNKEIKELGSIQKRIPNIRKLTNMLHKNNIYIIGRISVFQDPYLTKIKPEWALKKKSDGAIWKNSKGLSFLDPTNKNVYKYILAIALGAYNEGFDEINFDYVRYPSDGDTKNINYNFQKGQTRSNNIENFFKFISTGMKKNKDIPISVDLFGLTTEVKDDMGIGQVWEKALPYFDFISPMIYPSHYSSGHLGYKNPAEYPYEVVRKALSSAIKRTKLDGQNINKIRPWIQDFNLGAIYNKKMIKLEIKAVYDSGLSSWMLWDPTNRYNSGALKLENNM